MTDKRTIRRHNDDAYRLDGNLKQKYRYRKKSAENMAKYLLHFGIKPTIIKGDINLTYLAIRKQWKKQRKIISSDRSIYYEKQNKTNKDRYSTDKKYRELKRKQAAKQYLTRKEHVRKLEAKVKRLSN